MNDLNKILDSDANNSIQEYGDVLNIIQSRIATKNSDYLANLNDENVKEQMMQLIKKYIVDEKKRVNGYTENELVEKLYNDMAGASFLQKYIFDSADVEEVNINAWDDITVTYSKGKPVKLTDKERFSTSEQAVSIVKRMLNEKQVTIDNASPSVISYLSDGIRIAANIHPVISKRDAISASIRIIHPETITTNQLLEFESVNKDMLDFLIFCVKYKVSMVISGSVGSGKTTLLRALLTTISDNQRIVSIEEGSRELNLRKCDENGFAINNVLSKITIDTTSDVGKISQEQLLEMALRENPDYIAVGEMRSNEAYTGAEAARTGTATYTTTHAKNALYTYKRLMELAYKKYPMDIKFLTSQMVDSFPIIVFQSKFPDGSRRVDEIIEGIGYNFETSEILYHQLYKYDIEDNIYETDANGNKILKKIVGKHNKKGNISDSLKEHFLRMGASKSEIEKFIDPSIVTKVKSDSINSN